MIVLRLRSSEVLAPQLATGSSGRAKGGAVRPPRWRSPVPRSTPEASATSWRNAHDQRQRRDRTCHRHKDKDYNVIWFTEVCLSNVLRLETYIQDAEREGDSELADFFRKAQAESTKGAEAGKQLLKSRLGG